MAYVSNVACGLAWRWITPFGQAGRARAVQPEGRIVCAGWRHTVGSDALRDLGPRRRPIVNWRSTSPDDDDVSQRWRRCLHRFDAIGVISRDHDQVGLGIGCDRRELRGCQHRRERDGHDTGSHAADEPADERRVVVEHEQDALTGQHAEVAEQGLHPPHVGENISVRRRSALAADRHRLAVPGSDVAVEHPLAGVVQIHSGPLASLRSSCLRASHTRSRPVSRGSPSTAARPNRPSSRARSTPTISDSTYSRSSAVGSHDGTDDTHSASLTIRTLRADVSSGEGADGTIETNMWKLERRADVGQGTVPPIDSLLTVGDIVVAKRFVQGRQCACLPSGDAIICRVGHRAHVPRADDGRRLDAPPGTCPSVRRRSSWRHLSTSRHRTGRATPCNGS